MAAPSKKLSFGACFAIGNPTNLLDPFPYGGTLLGTVQDIGLTVVPIGDAIRGEDYGGAALRQILRIEQVTCELTTQGWDQDFVSRAMLNASTNPDGIPSIGDAQVGRFFDSTGAAFTLLFAAKKVDKDPSLIFYRALVDRPTLDKLAHGAHQPLEIRTTFTATHDSAGRKWRSNALSRLTL